MGVFRSITDTFTDRVFMRKTMYIALPVAMQQLLNTVVNMIDTLMIGRLGEISIAAVGLANKVFFVFALLVFGISSGASVLGAQFFGAGDRPNVKRTLGVSLVIGLAGSLLFVLFVRLSPVGVMGIFTPSPETKAIGAAYLAIACISYPFTAVSTIYVSLLRSVNRVKIAVASSVMAICVNVSLNYILIFGKLGMPAMGVEGAALATLIARVMEAAVILGYTYFGRTELAAGFRELLSLNRAFLKKYADTTLPVIANEFMWGLGTTVYSMAYGRMGDLAVAAITVAQTIQDLVFVMIHGLGAATAVILGNSMGADRLSEAEVYARKFIVLQFGVSLALAAFCLLIRGPLIGFYNLTPEVARSVSLCLVVFSMILIFKVFCNVQIVGILRSGGDTRFCLFADVTSVWLIGVPMAFFGGLYLKLPIHLVYAMVCLEEVYKSVVCFFRYRQKKWLRNLSVTEE
ncbi:MAG: MATE family efflux transporter [Lachnospiraceae bacterium]|nr:MATE family efflux transporter [Lachnospiraceae bacterium]